tara:strand:- start:859 stop:1848 length:990 start_codon:yes stop_codon:yes gene_type:complete
MRQLLNTIKNKIIILSGDPNSINSEIIYKCWKKLPPKIKKKIYFISNYKLLKKQLDKLGYYLKITKIENIFNNKNDNNLKLINIHLNFKNPFKVNKRETRNYILKSLNLAHKIITENNNIIGIINCPISKPSLNNKGFGVTEYLAKKCSIQNNSEVMLIRNNNLAVSPITTHNKIKDVSKRLKKNLIVNKVKKINTWFKEKLKKKPKIAMLGLNPHNAELRKDSEEVKIILPAIKKLKKKGLNIKGPYVADTIFINEYKKFDVIVGMYHDQVLAPFKTLYKYNAVNLTLGLDYLRLSPDHGVAVDLIGKNKANASSLIECINFLNKYHK